MPSPNFVLVIIGYAIGLGYSAVSAIGHFSIIERSLFLDSSEVDVNLVLCRKLLVSTRIKHGVAFILIFAFKPECGFFGMCCCSVLICKGHFGGTLPYRRSICTSVYVHVLMVVGRPVKRYAQVCCINFPVFPTGA